MSEVIKARSMPENFSVPVTVSGNLFTTRHESREFGFEVALPVEAKILERFVRELRGLAWNASEEARLKREGVLA